MPFSTKILARILLCFGLVPWIGEPSATRILLHEYSGFRACTFFGKRDFLVIRFSNPPLFLRCVRTDFSDLINHFKHEIPYRIFNPFLMQFDSQNAPQNVS